MNEKTALIIGGTAGLGLELSNILSESYNIIITGRTKPENNYQFYKLDLNSKNIAKELDLFIDAIPKIDLLLYAAGFYQEGKIDSLSDDDINTMSAVGLIAPAMLISRILKKQNMLEGFIAITSTAQRTPRVLEPMYNATKAALGMLANAISLDERVKKTLVAAPAGMITPFWKAYDKDTSAFLDPKWVAKEILENYSKHFVYKYITLLKSPPRVEEFETRS